ncbi:hypothetical protein BYT27DRAFT_7189336, partial [Phlegmacium glaucopus]
MNSLASHQKPQSDFPPRLHSEQMNRLLGSAHSILEQPPPPSLREILTAYRAKGDGDRDMLLAMLSAKTAEDQRQSSVASLHRTMLEICQQSTPSLPEQSSLTSANGSYHYPTPSFTQSPPLCDQQSSRHVNHRPHVLSRSHSPINPHPHLPPVRDVSMTHHLEHPRKRHRSSRSPHRSRGSAYETSHSEQFPPSPYSSSNRSESAEYSPRSRGSMTIGSLLSSRPNREANGDMPHQER